MQEPLIPVTRADRAQPRRRARSAYALLLGIVVSLGLAGLSAAPALAAPTPGDASGAFTVPSGVNPSHVVVELLTPDGSYYDTAATTASGSSATYSFTSEAPGQYLVYFSDSATADSVSPDYSGDGGTDDIQKAVPITITSGGTATVPSETLGNNATINGTVSDSNATTDTYQGVTITPIWNGAVLDPNFGSRTEEVTGATSYSIGGLPAGTYRIEYTAYGTNGVGTSYYFNVYLTSSGVSYDTQNETQYAIAAGSTTAANIAVPALGEVSGTVSGPSGPLYNDDVQFFTSLESLSSFAANSAYTAGDGTYSMLLLPGTYKVNFGAMPPQNLASAWYTDSATEAAATAVTVTAGSTTANINETLSSGGTITGTVMAAQGAAVLGGIDVSLLDAQGNDVEDATSQPNGTYTLTNVPAGTWYLEFNGGVADNGSYYATEFYGGTQSEFGSTPVTLTAGQNVTGVNGEMLPAGTAALGMPKESGGALSGLHDNKVALKFNVAAGTGAGYLQTLTVGLPKGFSWNAGKLAADLSLGSGITYTDVITDGSLVITLASGQPSVSFSLAPGGISVTKAIEKAAGGTTKKKTKKKKKHHSLAVAAKAKKKHKKVKKAKDTIESETINLSVSDTTGVITSLPFIVNKPH